SDLALRTGPMTGGMCEEKIARKRVRPPSTGSTYTMSASGRPVCGRAYTMLSIFTASTRFRDFTLSPVNGDRSGPWACRVGLCVGAGLGGGPALGDGVPPRARPIVAAAATPATAPVAERAIFLRVHIMPGPADQSQRQRS